jgi:hypothetical protein
MYRTGRMLGIALNATGRLVAVEYVRSPGVCTEQVKPAAEGWLVRVSTTPLTAPSDSRNT